MIVHPEKTESMLICCRQKRQNMKNNSFTVLYKNNPVKQVTNHKLLGIVIDQNLLWQDHVHSLVKQISSSVFQLSQIKHFLNEQSRRMFYFSFIQAKLDYCSVIWGKCSISIVKPLFSLQKRAVRLIVFKQSPGMSINQLFKHTDILPFHSGVKYNTLLLMFKILNDLAPKYMVSMIKQQQNHKSNRVILPQAKLDLFKTSFLYNGCKEWNMLPSIIRSMKSIVVFKKEAKKLLFDTYD